MGIASQREIEIQIYEAIKKGNVKIGDKIDLEMKLSIKNFQYSNAIEGKIIID